MTNCVGPRRAVALAGGHAPRPSPSETLVITGLLPIVDGGPLGGRRCQAVATAAVGEGDETALNPADGSPMVEVARLMAGEPPPAGHEMQAAGDQMGASGVGRRWSGSND